MEDLKTYGLTFLLFLLTTVGAFSQKNESHIVTSPTKRMKVVFYSNEKPVISGQVVVVEGVLVNDGLFVMYKENGSIRQTVHYKMGKMVKVTNFTEENKI